MGRANNYAGLCVGGPLAGKAIAYQHQAMPVVMSVTNRGQRKTFIYNWHHTGRQGIWIPQGETIHDAITAMALAYQEKMTGEGL
jgi:hypothetical protein